MPSSLTRSSLLRVAVCALSLGALLPAHAQAPPLIPLPFVSAYAGLPAGGPATACTNDIANNAGAHLGDGCLPSQATLASVYGAFTDAIGNVYITENGTNNDIRVVYKGGAVLMQLLMASNANLANFTPIPGRIYTLAGALSGTLTVKNGSKYSCNGQTTGPLALDSAGDGCPGAQAYVKPRGMMVDAYGNVFFVSTGGGNTVKVLYAGGAQVANLITLENPGATPQVGYVYKLSGQSTGGYAGDGGLASAASLVVVRDLVVDTAGNVFVSDGNSNATSGNTVRRIDGTTGLISTYAGGAGCTQPVASCPAGLSGDGGPAKAALLSGPYTLFLDASNNLFITEYSNNRIRVVYAGGKVAGIANPVAGNIYTYAGGGTQTVDGMTAAQSKFGSIQVAGSDTSGNVYLEDATTKNIWRFDAVSGVGYVIAGRPSGSAPTAGANCAGVTATAGPASTDNFGDGCPATQAAFSDIGRITFDPQGSAYLGENGNAIVRRLSLNGQLPATSVGAATMQPVAFKATTPVTLSSASLLQQGAAATEFSDAGGDTCTTTAALAAGQVCVFNVSLTPVHDGLRTATFQLSAGSGVSATEFLSGVGVAAGLAVDPATRSSLGSGLAPSGVVTDSSGNVYAADGAGNRVLKAAAGGGTLTTLATGLHAPTGLAVDSLGNLYIADTGSNSVVVVNAATGAAVANVGSGLSGPQGVAVDAFNNLFIADTGNNRVVEITAGAAQIATPLTGLASPKQLTFDSLGNLFVLDSGNSRIVELPSNGSQVVVALGSVVPTSVAVDPSGTFYTTDATTLQLLAFAPGSAMGTPLLTGLTKPAGITVDGDGNLFVADNSVDSLTLLNRSLATVPFPITNVNQSSTASLNLTNVGNRALSFTGGALYSSTGSAAFTLAPSSTNGCAAGVGYGAGLGCNLTATFLPTARGAATATVSFNTDAANNARALLSGNGQQLVATSTTVAVSAPVGAIVFGQSVTLIATVTPSASAGTPAGTVTFTVDGRAQTPQAFNATANTLQLSSLNVGTHTVSVAFSGDGVYASSSASASFTVGKAATSTTLTAAPMNSNGAISLVFTAVVASPANATETGSVTFFAGTLPIATVPLNPGTRSASYTSTVLGFTSNNYTAMYMGDANFAGSTSAVLAGAADFAIGTSASSFTIPQGGVATLSFTVASLYGSSGTLTPTCSGLPANSVCRFQPTTIPLSGTVAVQLQLYTNVNSNLASNGREISIVWAGLLPLGVALALTRRARRLRMATVLGLATLVALLPTTGCGTTPNAGASNQGLVTPIGSSTVTVTFTGAAPLTTHSTSFSLVVVANNTGF